MICDADRLKGFPDVIRSVFTNLPPPDTKGHEKQGSNSPPIRHWKNSSILTYRNIREKWFIVPVELGTHITAIDYKIWRTV